MKNSKFLKGQLWWLIFLKCWQQDDSRKRKLQQRRLFSDSWLVYQWISNRNQIEEWENNSWVCSHLSRFTNENTEKRKMRDEIIFLMSIVFWNLVATRRKKLILEGFLAKSEFALLKTRRTNERQPENWMAANHR
jgi:hypothetical protein